MFQTVEVIVSSLIPIFAKVKKSISLLWQAIMRRQQTHLDRVSRVLSLAESGRVLSGSPCSSPPTAPHHDAFSSAIAASVSSEQKLTPKPGVEVKSGLHEQLQELVSTAASEPLPPAGSHSFVSLPQLPPAPPPMPPLQAGGQGTFASAPAPYHEAPLPPQNSQHPLVQNFNPEMVTDGESALPSVILPWPEYMPP